jgi:hypothetical protein
MNTINKIYAYNLISNSEGKIFTCEYVKKDSTLRTINCRLQVKKGVTGKGLKYNPIERGLIPVYDMQNKGFRMLNLLTLKSLSINNSFYKVV